jgi:hypothetical protein
LQVIDNDGFMLRCDFLAKRVGLVFSLDWSDDEEIRSDSLRRKEEPKVEIGEIAKCSLICGLEGF